MKRLAGAGLGCSLIAAFAADYPWRDWVGHAHWANVGWIPFLSGPVSLPDIAQNIALFVPAGLLARLAVDRRAWQLAVFVSLPVALAGEWTQLYSHARFPSATDLLCNLAGSVCGVWLCEWMFHHGIERT